MALLIGSTVLLPLMLISPSSVEVAVVPDPELPDVVLVVLELQPGKQQIMVARQEKPMLNRAAESFENVINGVSLDIVQKGNVRPRQDTERHGRERAKLTPGRHVDEPRCRFVSMKIP